MAARVNAQGLIARPVVSPPGALATKGATPSLTTFHSSAQIPLPGDSKQDPDGRSPADRDGAELETPLPGFPNASQTSVLEAFGALLVGWRGAERQPSLATGLVSDYWGTRGWHWPLGISTGPGMPSSPLMVRLILVSPAFVPWGSHDKVPQIGCLINIILCLTSLGPED